MHVNAGSADCKELATSKANTGQVFSDAAKIAARVRAIIDEIDKNCRDLFGFERSIFDGKDLRTQQDAYNYITGFNTGYPGASENFVNLFGKVEAEYNAALKLFADSRNSYNLSCRNNKLSRGCDAEVNAQRCEVSKLLKCLEDAIEHVLSSITRIYKKIISMNKVVDEYKGRISASQDDYCKLKTIIIEFVRRLSEVHWDAHLIFVVGVQRKADEIYGAISEILVEYSPPCL